MEPHHLARAYKFRQAASRMERLAPLAHRLRVLIDLHWAGRDAHRSFDARSPEEAARLRTERAVRQHARSNRALYILRFVTGGERQ